LLFWRYHINFGGVVWFSVMFLVLLWCLLVAFIVGGILYGALWLFQ
jgi:hypothetical protein